MSTGLECEFFEPEMGKWFYVLQDSTCPVGAWDWREYATSYGPFGSLPAAQAHLEENHANPGGYSVIENDVFRIGKIYEGLIESARRPSRSRWAY